MGSPTFYWYPDGGTPAASREDTSLGEPLSALEEFPVVDREDAIGLSGRFGTAVLSAPRMAVRITLERFASAAVARSLVALEDHLARGGMCGFTADADDGWCGYLESSAERGDLLLRTTGNVWYFGGSLSSGDELVIQGLGPGRNREIAVVQSVSGDQITISAGLKYTHTDEIVLVRHRDCYPILYWPQSRRGSPALTTVRRIHWTWDITLEEDPAVAAALAGENQSPLLGATPTFAGITVGSTAIRVPGAYASSPLQTDAANPPQTLVARPVPVVRR